MPPLRRRLLPPPTGTAAAYAVHVLLICAVCCLLLMFVQELEEAFRIFDWGAYNERFDVSTCLQPEQLTSGTCASPLAGRPIALLQCCGDIEIINVDAAPLPLPLVLNPQPWAASLRRCLGAARRQHWA